MPSSDLPPLPPLVAYRHRPAWLRAWWLTDLGVWLADIYWADSRPEPDTLDNRMFIVERRVPAEEVARVDGQDYSRVPRRHT
ncbi:hypothetical protein SAMN05421505_12065 [Sinosporangium album]|uniref:Uncharacterized protein n=1 Tax=Sinosporangium album TaxID=504805 RepID=A0A1G8EEJ0_9ACTN|nr:hypothetical protein [Sinosporangium album]SDH68298.1 hypothetical protein SAMN05421505_12065 [Sinosporangium album]